MEISIKKLHPNAILPTYAHGPDEDAAMDLYAVEPALLVGPVEVVQTGIAIELPPGYYAQIRPRSGLAAKHAVTVNLGTIDPGFRGELRVTMFNHGLKPHAIHVGDRIAQLVVSRYEKIEWKEGELSNSVRGTDGFGSTGA